MTYAVILAGGIGSRFWPFSRELEPKQFLHVAGKSSLLQETIKRACSIIPAKNIFVISNKIYLHEIEKQSAGFRIPAENIILEPEGKNTAPAIGLCAKLIGDKDKDAVLVVMPADHYINSKDKFKDAIKKSINLAKNNYLVTVGIKPKSPSIGYGYIKVKGQNPKVKGQGLKVRVQKGCYIVDKFLEKPSLNKAKEYFKDKRFYWNSGIFIWRADIFLKELRSYLPKLYSVLQSIKNVDGISRVWHKIDAISVDYGIMEHSKRIALVPARFYWTDLGSWDALNEILPKDKKGNIIQADSLDVGSKGISVFSRSNRLISTIGVKDLIIADTSDALLVCHKDRAQEVKKIVDQLKSRKRKEHFVHTTEKRHWGSYTVLQQSTGFKIKIIEIEPKKRLSLQKHSRRAEHWVVVTGVAKVTGPGGVKTVKSNESVYIPKNSLHRLENPANSILKIVEVQTGTYLEEDDIQRFEDDFKR